MNITGFIKFSFFILAFAFSPYSSFPQVLFPKYEFRGVWVATVNNIDWPSKPGLPVEIMKREAMEILDLNKNLGMNAIIFQVRPSADAFYYSELEPWSKYLTGIPGKAPDPFFDPLQFWTEEAHKRGMELHAWLNPYRVSQNSSDPLAGNHIAFRNPEWVVNYDNKLYFDPGIPAARNHVIRVVGDIVRRYNIDAVHFDDYFYPYPARDIFPDHASFAQYNRAFSPDQKEHWRRENVDILIKMLNDTIKSIKPWVKFGISPFGVWRNRTSDPEGSDTRAGVTNYDHLYADVRKWLREGWIDYVIPQIYWETGHPAADFETLVRWWNRNSYGRDVYIGHAAYKVGTDSEPWKKSDQMPRQVKISRNFDQVKGSAYFSSKQFRRDLIGFHDSLASNLYRYPSLTPPMPWLHTKKPGTPVRIKTAGRRIHWQPAPGDQQQAGPLRYLVYLNEQGRVFNINDPKHIVQITDLNAVQFNRNRGKRIKYEVRLSALDRFNNESPLTAPVIIKL
jgi:uncharacterized lipoprotein YddW (UPF0748 family)